MTCASIALVHAFDFNGKKKLWTRQLAMFLGKEKGNPRANMTRKLPNSIEGRYVSQRGSSSSSSRLYPERGIVIRLVTQLRH